MTEYLSDRLHLFLAETRGLKETPELVDILAKAVEEQRDYAREIEGRELYAFERSALNAASDLRIEAPDRLDSLAAAVLEEPRRLFIETSGRDKSLVAANLRGFLDHESGRGQQEDRVEGYGERWGVFVDILGGGRCRFRSVYTRPMRWPDRAARLGDFTETLRRQPKTWQTPIRRSLSFDFSPSWRRVDIHHRLGMSRDEFDFALQRIGAGADPIIDQARAALKGAKSPRAQGRIQDAAWRLARFRDLMRAEDAPQSAMREISDLHANHEALALEDGITVIALLAVLQADSSDIRKTPRPAPRRRDGRAGSAKKKDKRQPEPAPGLSVVTLNLEDRGLQRLYETGTGSPVSDRSGDGGHEGRVRHPVRGHLFLARNGKMTWRKPHWRGSLDAPSIRRVVAPSHGQ